jgi:hypothetical protein
VPDDLAKEVESYAQVRGIVDEGVGADHVWHPLIFHFSFPLRRKWKKTRTRRTRTRLSCLKPKDCSAAEVIGLFTALHYEEPSQPFFT